MHLTFLELKEGSLGLEGMRLIHVQTLLELASLVCAVWVVLWKCSFESLAMAAWNSTSPSPSTFASRLGCSNSGWEVSNMHHTNVNVKSTSRKTKIKVTAMVKTSNLHNWQFKLINFNHWRYSSAPSVSMATNGSGDGMHILACFIAWGKNMLSFPHDHLAWSLLSRFRNLFPTMVVLIRRASWVLAWLTDATWTLRTIASTPPCTLSSAVVKS